MGVFSQLEKTRLVKKLKVARDRKRGTGADNKKVEGRKSHTELRPEVVAEAKRLRRASPKTGDRLSYRQISARHRQRTGPAIQSQKHQGNGRTAGAQSNGTRGDKWGIEYA